MESVREVVITGVGVISPIGIGKSALWESLCAARSGVQNVPEYLATELPVQFGATIRDFDAKQYVQPRKSLKVMSREIQTGFAAAAIAMRDAGLALGQVDPDRLGVVYGSEMLHCEIDDLRPAYRASVSQRKFEYSKWGSSGLACVYPLWMLKYLPNMVACHIGIANDARGPNNSIVQGEASSLLALIEGSRVIERGDADVLIVGGTGSRINQTSVVYRGDATLSHRGEAPESASRPFDLKRDGAVNGEGAAALILESRAHAEARNANILARILGTGLGFESPEPATNPAGRGIAHSIRQALRSAQLKPSDIGFVKAHGISKVLDDRREAQAIHDCLADVPVTAPKSFFGNLGAGGGAVEAIAALLALHYRSVPVTLNYEFPDPTCPVNVVARSPLPVTKDSALVLSQSGTGQAAAVLFASPSRKCEL